MYKATVTYPYGLGRKIKAMCYARTKFGAWLKGWWAIRHSNKDFFEIKVSAE